LIDIPATVRGSRFRRVGAITLASIIAMSSPWWAGRAARAMSFFRVRSVEVDGARYTDPGEIVTRLGVDSTVSVWDNLGPLTARMRGLAQLRSVEIGRKLPGTLVVALSERTPVALVPDPTGGPLRAYDEAGMPLPIDLARADVDAPVLERPDLAALRVLGALRASQPAVYAKVSDVRRAPTGEFVFTMSGMTVRANPDVELERFNEAMLVGADLGRRHLTVTELDLRFRDQVVVRH
jgi:cell division protein FtsQ